MLMLSSNIWVTEPIDGYSSADAAALRDAMLEKGLSIASVKRNFSTIRSIINLTISEQGLDCGNAFARTFMPETDRQRRLPIPIDCIRAIQSDCLIWMMICAGL